MLYGIKQVKEVTDVGEVNFWLKNNWVLLAVGSGRCQTVFIMGTRYTEKEDLQ